MNTLHNANPLIEADDRIESPLPIETTVRWFIGSALPMLAMDRPIAVSAVSYRRIGDYRGGEVAVAGRHVRAAAFPGSFRANLWAAVAARLSDRRLRAEDVALILAHDAAAAESEMVSSMLAAEMQLADAPGRPLAILYAGFHGFGACVESARRIAARRDDAHVTFVTCTCCLPAKRAQLLPLVDAGVLRSLVVVDSCGGEDEMGEIVTAVARLR